MAEPVNENDLIAWAMKLFGGTSLQPAATLASILADYLETDKSVLCEGHMKC